MQFIKVPVLTFITEIEMISQLAKLELHKFNPIPVIRMEKSVESAVGNS